MKFRYSIRTLLALVTGIAVCAGVPYLIPRSRSLRVSERYCGYYRGLGLDEGGGYFGTNWYRVVVDEAPNGRWEVEINGQEYAPYRGYYPTGSLRERGTCLVDTSGIDIFPDRTDVLDAEYYDPDGNLVSRVTGGTGKQILCDVNGRPQWEAHLDGGQRTLLRTWHANGQLAFESIGDSNGAYTAYFPNGQVKYHGEFKNGKRTGTMTEYSVDGQIESETTYDEDGLVESQAVHDEES